MNESLPEIIIMSDSAVVPNHVILSFCLLSILQPELSCGLKLEWPRVSNTDHGVTEWPFNEQGLQLGSFAGVFAFLWELITTLTHEKIF